MVEFYSNWINQYPIFSIEDGLDENDWDVGNYLQKSWREIQLVGDDLFVTNTEN